MPLLTVRLSDEDYAALKALAADTSMAGLIRSWIAGTGPAVELAGRAHTKNSTVVPPSEGHFGAPRPAPKTGKKR